MSSVNTNDSPYPERKADLEQGDAGTAEIEWAANNQHSLPMQYDRNGHPLEPQPTADPHDPLNFPRWQKWGLMAVLSYWSFIGTTNIIIVGPSFFDLAKNFDVSFTSLAYTINGPLLAYGLGSFFWVPFSNVFGVRMSFLLSSITAGSFSIWAATTSSFSGFVAARILAAFFFASPEALGPQIVADVFFLHERATWTSVFTFFQFQGFCVAGLIGGYGAQNLGWHAPSWIMVGLAYGAFLAILVGLPETSYTRAGKFKSEDKRKLSDSFKIWSASGGGDSKVKAPLKAFVYPWYFLPHPVVICNTVLLSLILSTNDYILTTSNTSFPIVYGFSLSGVALTNIAPMIGTLLGALYGGFGNDRFVAWQRKRAGGAFRPEMRLPMLMLTALTGPAGLIMFGCATQYHEHWIAPLIGEALTNFTITVGGNIVVTYLADTYLERTDATLVLVNGLKNLSAFGLVYAVNPWNMKSGYAVAFGCLSVITFACHLPMAWLYFKGESIRAWQTRKFTHARVGGHGEGF